MQKLIIFIATSVGTYTAYTGYSKSSVKVVFREQEPDTPGTGMATMPMSLN
jgi:hypothetical protein